MTHEEGLHTVSAFLKYVRIKIIGAPLTVLAPVDKSLQDEAIMQLGKSVLIKDPEGQKRLLELFKFNELLLDSSVKEVKEDTIFLNDSSKVHIACHSINLVKQTALENSTSFAYMWDGDDSKGSMVYTNAIDAGADLDSQDTYGWLHSYYASNGIEPSCDRSRSFSTSRCWSEYCH